MFFLLTVYIGFLVYHIGILSWFLWLCYKLCTFLGSTLFLCFDVFYVHKV